MLYVLLFLFGLAFDTLWVLCLYFVSTRAKSIWRRHLATLTSVSLAGLGALSQANISWNTWLIIPEISGMFIGMYVGMYVADKVEKAAGVDEDRGS
jgi:hypothetical protein